jgi:hypothetical protein
MDRSNMRYEDQGSIPLEPIYSQTEGLHYMLNFTVALALFIGCALLWLGIKGRVLWLKVWSLGLILASLAYLGAALLGLTGRGPG